MKKAWWMLLLMLIIFSAAASASPKQYHLTLLAVQEENNTYIGSTADLYLELKPGSGRVFLDTFPLTKMDTQVSTRFAKEIACKHYKLDCEDYDFIYTIKAESNIVGGPSAGAAIAALTAIAVMDLNYDQNVAITGTINSGAIIGPVGGVKEKLDAAAQYRLKKVLIAKGTAEFAQESENENLSGNFSVGTVNDTVNNSNKSEALNLVNYARENLSLEVIEVMDLDEVMFHLVGKQLNSKEIQLKEDPQYQEIMSGLQGLLCRRTDKLEKDLQAEGIVLNSSIQEMLLEKKLSSDNATMKGDFYSAASYCFGINVLLKSYYYELNKASPLAMKELFTILEKKVNELELKLGQQEIKTISDLQTFMVVKERLDDVKEQIRLFRESQDVNEKYYLLGYAEERYFTALSWVHFFAMDGKKLVLSKEQLKASCQEKISEAEERHQYASIFIGGLLASPIEEKIALADDALEMKEYELCLMKAIQAKGEADAILSSMGQSDEAFKELLEGKTKAVERIIAENSAEGMFPILGYSYLQYAKALKEQEPFTSLIYLEYALEMSDLGIYFPEEETFWEKTADKLKLFSSEFLFLEGFVLGLIVMLLSFSLWKKLAPRREKSRKIISRKFRKKKKVAAGKITEKSSRISERPLP